MKHQAIRDRLQNWGRWVNESISGTLGYQKETPFSRCRTDVARTEEPYEARIYGEESDAIKVNNAMKQLRFSNTQQWLALHCRYAGNPHADSYKGKQLLIREIGLVMGGIGERAVEGHLDRAYASLEALLSQGRPEQRAPQGARPPGGATAGR